IRAGQASSGLDVNSGSPLEVQSSAKELGELDALTVRNAAAQKAYGFQTQATGFEAQAGLDRSAASSALTGGFISGVGSILGGASSVSDKWLRLNDAGAFGPKSPLGAVGGGLPL